ncbi:uncharacterized protein [Oscarella lobularis]|uniref:uncharacterized protein n=1 Tax=Oscarella lobularis TaxID=121494 RepID=UPI003313C864
MAFTELRATGEFSDISVTVQGETLNLHKFPLLARSKYFHGLVSSKMTDSNAVTLDGLPGGLETMTLAADFCYNIDIRPKITSENVGPLMCAASYLLMTGPDNLLDIASSTLKHLTQENSLNCLRILKGCCNTATSAESEEIIDQCAKALIDYHWKKARLLTSEDERALLQELPLKWILILLDYMKEMESSPIMESDVIMTVVRWSEADERLLELIKSETDVKLVATPDLASEESLEEERATIEMVPRNSACEETIVSSEEVQEEATTADIEMVSSLPEAGDTTFNVVFDALAERLPHPSLVESGPHRISASTCLWYCQALLFACHHELRSYDKLLQCCSFLQSRLTVDHCKDFSPDLIKSMNLRSCEALGDDSGVSRENICALNDQYLRLHCERGSIDASGFLTVMKSVRDLRGPASSFDRSFEAFEALRRSSSVLPQEDVKEVCDSIDFSKLSSEFLWRAASNDGIPKEIVLPRVVELCEQLRSDLAQSRANAQMADQRANRTARELEYQTRRLNAQSARVVRLEADISGLRRLERDYHKSKKENSFLQKETERLRNRRNELKKDLNEIRRSFGLGKK